MVYRLRCVWRQ